MFSQKDLRDLFTLKADVDSVAKGGEGITETGELTKGRGVVDVDADIEGKEAEDNSETLEMVLKSKGLAGKCSFYQYNVVPWKVKVFLERLHTNVHFTQACLIMILLISRTQRNHSV